MSQLAAKWDSDWAGGSAAEKSQVCANFGYSPADTVAGATDAVWAFVEANYDAEHRGDITRRSIRQMYETKLSTHC